MAACLQEESFYCCSVCLDDMTTRHPRLLACHHSFCEECLQKLVRKGNIECPTCRYVTAVSRNDVTTLSKNFLLLEVKEREKKFFSTSKSAALCELCNEELASHNCLDCNELMCQICTIKHRKTRRFKKHQMVTKCKYHNEGITHMCEKCVKELCSKCITVDHSDHDEFVHDYKHGMELLHLNIERMASKVSEDISYFEDILEKDREKIMKENETQKSLQTKRDKHLFEAAKLSNILDDIIRKHDEYDIIQHKYEDTVKSGKEVLRNLRKVNRVESSKFLMAYPEIKEQLEGALNQTSEVKGKFDYTYVPEEPLADYDSLIFPIHLTEKPKAKKILTEKEEFKLKIPCQVACLDNSLLAIADLKEEQVLVVNHDGDVIRSYNVESENGAVTYVHSNDGRTLYIVQKNCTTSVWYLSTNMKTYHPALSDMMGICVLNENKYIVYNSTTVCEYVPRTNKVKKVTKKVM